MPAGLQPVYQLHRAMMLNLHPACQFANARTNTFRHALNGEHKLILAALQAGLLYGPLAEVEELANLVAELGQSLIVRQRELFHSAAGGAFMLAVSTINYIVQRYIESIRPHSSSSRVTDHRHTDPRWHLPLLVSLPVSS